MTPVRTMSLDFYGYFQLAGLGLFLLVVVWRAVSVAKKARRKPVHLSLQHNGVQHGVVLVLFIGVNLWIAMILLHVLAPEVCIPPSFPYRTLAALWMRFPGAVLIGIGFSLFVLALRTLGVFWRLGIDEQHPGALVTTGVYLSHVIRLPCSICIFSAPSCLTVCWSSCCFGCLLRWYCTCRFCRRSAFCYATMGLRTVAMPVAHGVISLSHCVNGWRVMRYGVERFSYQITITRGGYDAIRTFGTHRVVSQ